MKTKRPQITIIDDPIPTPEKEEQNKILLAAHALIRYNEMRDDGVITEVEYYDYDGRTVSLLSFVIQLNERVYKNHNVELQYLFAPATFIMEITEDARYMSGNIIHEMMERANTGEILYAGIIFKPYSSKLDLSTQAEQIYINNKDVKIGVIKFNENRMRE